MRAVVFTLGCKVNRYESDVIEQDLRERGFDVFDELVSADVYILNTCAVTQEAERKSRQAIARCKALNPNGKIFVCGCASQRDPDAFCKENVVYICGSADKRSVVDHIPDTMRSVDLTALPTTYEDSFLTAANKTRAYVKIQDGCNRFCSYCIIPYLRGRSRSRSIDSIVSEISVLSKSTAEIVLIGINLMEYGADIGTDLPTLIRALQPFDVRIRLGSFYAEGITKELLDALFSLPKFCPHFHLSLQSGDDEVLRAMNRRYVASDYEEKIAWIRSYDKNACITTDVITGFPTETEENHKNSMDFIRKVGFSDIHIFPFSAREGTRAAKLPKLPSEVVRKRKGELSDLKKELIDEYLTKNIGVEQKVLTEEKEGEYYCGYSQYYIRVYTNKSGEISCFPTQKYNDGLKEV